MNDSEIRFQDVRFVPWIGKHYHTSRFGKRLLILGESHYGTPENQKDRNFTRRLTQDYVKGAWSHRFWTIVGQTIDGRHYTEFERPELWEHISFYNYVQDIVLKGKTPTKKNWTTGPLGFREILNVLKPNLIISCGKRLEANLPKNWESEQEIGDEFKTKTRRYKSDKGLYSELVTIYHPSSWGFKYKKWHDVIKAVL